MNRFLIATAFATTLFAAPAFADCAADMTKITDAMKTAKMDDAQTKSSKDMMDKAMAAQTAKDEKACTDQTTQLKTMLNIKE